VLPSLQHLQQPDAEADNSISVSRKSVKQLGGRPFIWSRASGWRWIRKRNSVEFCANLGKSATETLTMARQALGGESTSRTRTAQIHRDRKKARQVKGTVRNMLKILFHIEGIVHKAIQSVPHTTKTF
jgi:hypothetical protein